MVHRTVVLLGLFLATLIWHVSSVSHALMPRVSNACDERRTPGLICQSCELLATCVRINTGWITVPVETCDKESGFYCNINDRGCSNATGPCHPLGYEGNFACTSEGIFPDPYDCQKYHMCYRAGSTLVSANIECGSNKAFSVESVQCSLSITDAACTKLQYNCTEVGDSGPWPGNNNIFYICKATVEHNTRILYPTLYRCSPGEVFHNMNCFPKESIVNVTTSTSTRSNSSNSSVSTPSEIQCQDGFIGLMVDPLDCQSYYYCNGNGKIQRYTCPARTHFSQSVQSCIFGNC